MVYKILWSSKATGCLDAINLIVSKTMVLSKTSLFWSFINSTHDLFFLNHSFVFL
jgi:hypothetical protein